MILPVARMYAVQAHDAAQPQHTLWLLFPDRVHAEQWAGNKTSVWRVHPWSSYQVKLFPTEAGMPILEANRPIPTAPENN